MSLPDWARAHGGPLLDAQIRRTPDDFLVTEIIDFELTGDGEHDFLWIEKTDANTAWVSRQLARHAVVPPVDVGYAGLKDRRAITQQWFSVRRPTGAGTDWAAFDADGVQILKIERHNRKLRRGAHRANAFRIALRSVAIDEQRESIRERIQLIAASGVPNYFGEQRFGRDGGNLELVQSVFAGRRVRRDKRSIAISAARSFLFNQILDARVRKKTWNRLETGDLANLDGSASVFSVDELTPELVQRCSAGDLHPTGSLWGDGAPCTTANVAEAECDAVASYESFTAGLSKARVEAASRPLRLPVADFTVEFDAGVAWLAFRLQKGSYATTVLRELFRLSSANS